MALLPFDDRDGFIWMDGQMLPWREARGHILCHGLHYASSVFEGERAYNGQIFRSADHNARLRQSANYLDFDLPISDAELEGIKYEVLKANNIVDGYLRPFAWRGSEMMAISAQETTTHIAVAAWNWPSYFDPETKMRGITLDIASWRRPNPESAPVHAKAAGLYMICTLSKHEAERKGFQDAMMLDYRGYVAEATGANVFFVMSDGRLHTPKADCFLNGLTRQTVIDLAQQNGLEVVERHILPEEMAEARECFLTGTAAEITPVSKIGEYEFKPAEVNKMLIDAYTDLVTTGAARKAS